MSEHGWQDAVALAVALYAAWRLLRRRQRKPKAPLVTLGRAPRRDAGLPSEGPSHSVDTR